MKKWAYIYIRVCICVCVCVCVCEFLNIYKHTRGVMGIVAGNGHGDTSSNPGRD